MKSRSFFFGRLLLPAAAFILFSGSVANIFAANLWDGGGGNANWTTALNWDDNLTATSGSTSDVRFGGTTGLSSINDYSGYTAWRNILFDSGAGSFILTSASGANWDLYGKIENNSTNAQSVTIDAISLKSATANEFDATAGNLTITAKDIYTNGNNLTFWGAKTLTVNNGGGSGISQGGKVILGSSFTGTAILTGSNAYTGNTEINSGTLKVGHNSGLGSSTVFVGNGGATGTAATLLLTGSGLSVTNNLNTNAGTNSNRTIGGDNTSGTNTFTGTLAMASGGSATLTAAAGGTVAFTGVISGTGQGITKTGRGTVTLSAANTYTGATAVNAGTLKLDFSAAGAPTTNIVSASSALQLGGGTLQIAGSTPLATTQTFASSAVNAGTSVVSATSVGGTNVTVNLGAITRSNGGALKIVTPANGGINTAAGTAGILLDASNIPLGNFNGTDFVGRNASGNLVSGSSVTTYTANTAGTGNVLFGASFVATVLDFVNGNTTTGVRLNSTAATINGLRFNQSQLTAGGGTWFIDTSSAGRLMNVGSILMTANMGTSGVTISGAGGIRAFANSKDIVLMQENTGSLLTISTTIQDRTTSLLTKSGAGTAVITGNNAYVGQTFINEGALSINSNASLGAIGTGATINLNGGTLLATTNLTLDNAGASKRNMVLGNNGGTFAAITGTTMTVTGFVSGGSASPLTIGGSSAATGATDRGGAVVLSAANSYSGGTIVSGSGTLNINGINALGGANYGGLTLNGGTLQYATAFSGNGSGDLSGNAGVTIASGGGTIDTNGNSVTYAGSIGNGGSGSLTKAGAGTLTLSSAITYTGGTVVSGGTLSAGSSTVFGTGAVTIGSGGTLSSSNSNLSLGNLTLTGGGTIVLGAAGNQITSSGAVSITGSSNLLSLGGSAASAGNTYTLLSGTSLSAAGISLTGTAVGGSTVALGSSSTVGRTNYAFSAVGNALQLGVTGGAFNLTWNGGNANWNTTDANWQKDGIGSNIVFFTGDNITISTGDSIAVDAGGVAAGTLVVNNASGTATLTGGTVAAVSLAKSGAGTLQLNNTISGATLAVSAGELALGAQNQSFANVSLTSGSITGSTAVLTGTGSAFALQTGSVSAILNGSVGLNKTTGGTVTLSGANTYTGTTSVTNGTLAISGSGTLGNGAALTLGGGTVALGGSSQTVGAVSITAAATSGNTIENGSLTGTSYAASNASDNAIVTANLLANGAAGLNKSGAGTLTLSGANTYTGATLVKNGSLVLDGGDSRLLNTGSAVIGDVATSGKLILGGTTVANQAFTGLTTTGLGGSVVGGNAANSTLTLDIAGTNTFGGTLGGAGTNENNLALIKSGVGTLTLSVANTYTGGTQLNGGTLALGEYRAAGTGTITAANGTTIAALAGVGSNAVGNAITISGTNASITLTNNNASGGINSLITGSAGQTVTISNAGGTVVNMNSSSKQFQNFLGTVSVASGQSLAFRSTSLNNGGDNTLFTINGSLSSRNGGNVALGALSGSGTVSMGGSGNNNVWLTYTIGARNTNTNFSGVIQDADTVNGKRVAIVKTGSAIQTLSGSNTYTGTTAVNQGTLVVTGSIGNSAVSVSNAGTVLASGATGTIGQSVTVNTGAILAVGGVNAVGTATVGSGGLDIKSSSIFEWDLTTNSSSSGFDTVATSNNGNLTVASGAIFKVVLGGSVSAADSFWTSTQTWNIFSVNGTGTTTQAISGHLFDTFQVVDATTGSLFAGASGSFSFTGSTLTWSAVPEPTSAFAGLLIAAGLLRRRRSA